MKRNLIIGGIIITAVGITMGVTNPKPEAYTEYISEKILAQGEKALCEKTEICNKNNPSTLIKDTVNIFKGQVAKPVIEKVVEKTTNHQNLFFFSLYTTEISDVGAIKTIGAFNHFFTYSKS